MVINKRREVENGVQKAAPGGKIVTHLPNVHDLDAFAQGDCPQWFEVDIQTDPLNYAGNRLPPPLLRPILECTRRHE
jgi:hypothetical protein